MAAPVQDWTPGTLPEALSAAIFDGALIRFGGLGAVRQLLRRTVSIVADVFGTTELPGAERRFAPARFRDLAGSARSAVAEDAEANRHWRQCLDDIGYDASASYLDRVRLRIVPSQPVAYGRAVCPLPAHRDTWGSGISAQVNWWLPLHPLSASRTMVVWPDAFRRPVANDSAAWDYDAARRQSGAGMALLPSACEPQDGPGQPVLIEPGELLAFSAAHLHASIADQSGACRFSVDTRTVWSGDLTAGRGAPEVDGVSPKARWEWFRPPAGSAGQGRLSP